MDIAIGLLGTGIIVFMLIDMLWTTMGEGGGPLSQRLLNTAWRGILQIHRYYKNRRFYSFAGVLLVILVVIIWIVLLWLGWVLIFLTPEQAVVNTSTGEPASFWDRVYFVGFTLFTLGVGDFRPQLVLYQVLTNVASLSGLFLMTLSITYLLSLVQAAQQKRQLGVHISGLGRTAEEMLLTTWNGARFDALEEHLVTLTSEVAGLKQRHLTYPGLHYFQGLDPAEASALSIAALDDALSVIRYGMEPGEYINSGLLVSTRHVLSEFLNTLDATFVDPADEAPPLPSLQPLRERGFPVVEDDVFRSRMASQTKRRKLLKALVVNDAWDWELLRPEQHEERTLEPDEA